MRKALPFAAALVWLVLAPSPAFAWGAVAHRFIMNRAIDLLPAAIKPFFDYHRAELTVRVMDPDTWREVGWDDGPNHFLDFGVLEYGPYPFTELPRDYAAAVDKFGAETVKRYGLVPWRVAEEFGNTRRAFEKFKANGIYASIDTVLFAAVMSHYVQDATQPFHATDNFNGQFSNQFGIHARFEDELFERFQSRLTITPSPVKPVTNARDFTFDMLLAGYLLVKPVLDADKDAVAGKQVYDKDYYEKFFVKVKPILEKRIGDAITATASLIVSAWEQAGKPALRTSVPYPEQKVGQ